MKLGTCIACKFENFLAESHCQKCGSEIPDLPKKTKGFFGRIKDSLTKTGLKKTQMDGLRRIFRTALHDGIITDKELKILSNFYEESELSRKDFASIRDEVFLEYVNNVLRDRRISPEEEGAISNIANKLGFSRSSLNELRRTFRFYELLHAIETCAIENLPIAGASRVILRNREVDYFTANGSLMEERVINRRLVGGSHGISIPTPLKGVRYRVGQSRGKMVSERGIVPVSYGEFTVTNKRMVFSGDKKSVNAEFPKLQDFELFSDAIRFSLTTRQTPITVLFDDSRCAEVVGLYVQRLIRGI